MTLLGLALAAQIAAPAEFFEEKVRPLLAARCIGCHGDARVSGLRLDSREGMLAGGRRGPAIVPGDPARSLVIAAITRTHEVLKMPPGEKLPDAEIDALTTWIAGGAQWPAYKPLRATSGKIAAGDRQWWAFQPLHPPARATIDSLIGAKLRDNNITPAPAADRRTLLRRLSFDLTGLPPRPEDADAFLADTSTHAVAIQVDRLLASPHFGERWARHWLDVARYAEDDVLGLSQEKYPNAWRYRDWVIDAFNRDLPYDVFVKAQIAADQMEGDYGMDLRPALGLFGLGPWQYTVSPPPQARADERHDRIDVVTRGFLALTAACSRCHDHKFDPITTRDYYGLAGVFASTEYREVPLAAPDEVAAFERHQQRTREQEKRLKDFADRQRVELGEILAAQTARYLNALRSGKSEGLTTAVLDRWRRLLNQPEQDHPLWKDWNTDGGPERIQDLVLAVMDEKKEIDEAKRQAVERSRPNKGASKTRLPNGFETYDEFCPGCDVAVRSMDRDRYMLWQDLFREPSRERTPAGVLYFSDKELAGFLSGEWRAHLDSLRTDLERIRKAAPPPYAFLHGVTDKARPANLRIALRGDPYTLGEEVPRRFLEVLCDGEPVVWTEASGRFQLAEAIVRQPLAARVAANRVWMHLFGSAIVASASNFGRFGDRPSHPELLDYLAARLMQNRWSMKSLIREIVLSETYQRSAARVAAGEVADQSNKFYWRASRRRLDAESLRDAILFVSGALEAKLGGPSEELTPESRRRTIYGRVSRFRLPEPLQLFDFPNPSITAEKRTVTHVPLQRLYFMNNPFVARNAEAVPHDNLRRLYRVLFQRDPDETEIRMAAEFLRAGGSSPQLAQALLSSNEFLFVD